MAPEFSHTEAQALTKRCCGPLPCGRPKNSTYHGANIIENGVRYCVASECMAWTWSGHIPHAVGFCGLAKG